MPRVKRGKGHLKHRKALLKRVKGFEAGRKKLIKLAKTAEMKAGAHAYRDRRVKKRLMRGLWHVRINAAVRAEGMSYSAFMGAMGKKGSHLNRKVLSEIADQYPTIFAHIVSLAK